jgi:DNA invertase Pin-like site-specific DNA recombinase
MNVVIYLRMSTDKQDTSIPQQREALLRHAERQGYAVAGEYRDEGISGDDTRKRKGFQKMIREVTTSGIDRILCFDQDRFGRFDMIEAGWWITPLRDAGVSLETIAQGVIDWCDFAGRLTYAVAQEGKHQFLRDLSRNALRGQVARAKEGSGLCGGSAPFGYRRQTVDEGRRRKASLVIHPAEARVVKMIFETYAKSGGTLLAVGQLLNRENIPSPNKKSAWHRNAVRRILTNINYMGDYAWGQTTSGKYHVRVGDDITPCRSSRRRLKNDPIIHRDMIPAIVSRPLFEKVQALLARRRRATRRQSTARPLSGLVFCAKCGSPMHVNFNDYRCSRAVDFGDGTRCLNTPARGDELLEAIVEGLEKHLLAPGKLAAVRKKLAAIVAAEKKAIGADDGQAITREIEDLDRQVAEGISRITLIPRSLVADMAKGLDALRSQRDSLIKQRDAIGSRRKAEQLPVEKRVAECLAAAKSLGGTIKSNSPTEVNEALRNLGVSVVFDAVHADVRISAPASGEGLLAGSRAPLAQNSQSPFRPSATYATCYAHPPERNKSKELEIVAFRVKLKPFVRRRGPRKKAS